MGRHLIENSIVEACLPALFLEQYFYWRPTDSMGYFFLKRLAFWDIHKPVLAVHSVPLSPNTSNLYNDQYEHG